ncbi:bifunctional biotin--[acetyl-CoA-carboxylase] ligase/pantothenate kinase, partial [Kingella kingae]|nr:bifunctional biotin--[acetyl-CoA-carboxylase] ligase/pantothenate kinase [Kingella kingae]
MADGRAHHITELARAIERVPQQLNSIWQQVPAHLQPLLRQRDGVWQLSRPLAWLDDAANLAPFALTVLRETTSSNDVLLNAARNGESIHRKVVVAHRQSAGRGRQGRTWQHRVGECLMFSVGWTM